MPVRKPVSISPVMARLSQYIAAAPRKALPAAALEATRHHVLDTLAAMVLGAKLLPGKMAVSYAKTLGGRPEATVVGSRALTSVVNAALARLEFAGSQSRPKEYDTWRPNPPTSALRRTRPSSMSRITSTAITLKVISRTRRRITA